MAHSGTNKNEEVQNDYDIEHEKNKPDNVDVDHQKINDQIEIQSNDNNDVNANNNHEDLKDSIEGGGEGDERDLEHETKIIDINNTNNCERCISIQSELDKCKAEKLDYEKQLLALKARIEIINGDLEREVQRRCDLEQRFTEEAKRSTDQIEELIAKSDQDDVKLNELKKRLDLYVNETSSMIESFTTSREVLTSQLLELRQENDYLLGKYIGKSRDLQNEEINLPQTVEELQFHCLTLNEKLILATLAKEQLEETLMRSTSETR